MPERRTFERERAREPDDRHLRRGVSGHACDAPEPGTRRQVEDPAVPRGAHRSPRGSRHVEVPADLARDDGVEQLRHIVSELGLAHDPGVVDEHVDTAKRIERRRDDRLAALDRRHGVGRHGRRPARRLDLGDDGGRRVLGWSVTRSIGVADGDAEVVHDDARSSRRQQQRVRAPEVATGAGDDRDAAVPSELARAHAGVRVTRCGRLDVVDLVQLGCVVPQHAAADVVGLTGEARVDLLAHVAVQADRVRVVGLEQDPVGADRIDHGRDGALLEEVAAVDLALEVLARLHLEVRALAPHLAVLECVVGRLEDERQEADAALDRDEAQRWGTAPARPTSAGRRSAGRSRGRAPTDVGTYVAPMPCALSRSGAKPTREVAAADVEADRQPGLCDGRPERIPVAVAEVGQAEVLRLAREQARRGARSRHRVDLRDRGVDVPERRRHDGSKRRGSAAHQSTRKSLYARTHASMSSGSPSWRNTWFPNPPTFGYSACAQTPIESMYSSRACAFHDARGTSSMLRGAAGTVRASPRRPCGRRARGGVPSPMCHTSWPVVGLRIEVRRLVTELRRHPARPHVSGLGDVRVDVDHPVHCGLSGSARPSRRGPY